MLLNTEIGYTQKPSLWGQNYSNGRGLFSSSGVLHTWPNLLNCAYKYLSGTPLPTLSGFLSTHLVREGPSPVTITCRQVTAAALGSWLAAVIFDAVIPYLYFSSTDLHTSRFLFYVFQINIFFYQMFLGAGHRIRVGRVQGKLYYSSAHPPPQIPLFSTKVLKKRDIGPE